MADNISAEQRFVNMRAVKGKNTKPELFVRRALYRSGFRLRLHNAELPGKPDVVLGKLHTVVFIHGCFWHGHRCRRGALPKTRPEFWEPKIRKNVARDRQAARALRRAGWELKEKTDRLIADLRRRPAKRKRNSKLPGIVVAEPSIGDAMTSGSDWWL
jgi:DNA mismatch endonuclease (patch repair protein)